MHKNDPEIQMTYSSGNVFADLGFDDAEAQVLALRADLMAQLARRLESEGMTQSVAASRLGVSQSRVSDLVRGKVERFSLDMLLTFAARLGMPARVLIGG
ncbi:transcriptional regulator [Lysobacteraceae bacterium NML120232]|nr:transcriptional regulator [Xanthomonadaceae bacterium NML120232]